jgi:hypothetical protein
LKSITLAKDQYSAQTFQSDYVFKNNEFEHGIFASEIVLSGGSLIFYGDYKAVS